MSRKEMSMCTGLRSQILHACKAEKSCPTDQIKQATLRLIECAINDRDVCARARGDGGDCADEDVQHVLELLAQQLEISAAKHDQEGRIEDAIRERSEVEIIQQFLPKPLSDENLIMAVKQIIQELDAHKLTDLGRCMTALKKRYPNQINSSSARAALCTEFNKLI